MKQKILIIDDEADFCAIMKLYFEKKDYIVETACSIEKGMDHCRQFRPDILFLDNNLPDGNGWEIVEKIVDLIPQIRIYLISAHRNRSAYTGPHKIACIWEKPISINILNEYF